MSTKANRRGNRNVDLINTVINRQKINFFKLHVLRGDGLRFVSAWGIFDRTWFDIRVPAIRVCDMTLSERRVSSFSKP